MAAALEFRLRRHASFREKLRQLVGKFGTNNIQQESAGA
jgi:hypothetical protein